MKNKNLTLKLVYAAVCLALALVLPFLTGQIPQIGKLLSPMHIPAFLAGFLCGPVWGLCVGFVAPLLRSALFGMPVLFPMATMMAFELATYAVACGILYRIFPKKIPHIYCTLLISMLCGRIVYGIAAMVCFGITGAGYSLAAWFSGTITGAIPGIILHLILVPVIVIALQRAELIPGEEK
ncbi:MAG: ECF transporter S component [Lachnospiraceae bacterium]|nr:ECF transporter S component [Lachnospiraceae bacterium]